ncbi:Aste57867_20462 [Aphanomyces stellatus]|uniref:Aste57867_20462 protein n=1 Tax=Aphanomyces stellatus TaxID=120398 RepID=A0A485LF66_9STRA|nr:hypothetical protein As57867_020396 [Aphanomyces stellatus]VFT97148.1 Aste57867_20462 [Aphanomyces stellatus]
MRYKWLFLLASKSESLANLKKFHVSVERQHDYKLKTIMTDYAKEYMSKELNAYCSGIGIQQLYTNPYSPEENCVVEKSNYTVMNKVRRMLQACGMDNRYWGEALSYVVYTENRSPTKALGGKTPFEALFGRKPNIDHLRPFGCTAFAFIDKAKRTKLDPRATKYVFVGYASQHKSYRLVDCDSGQLFDCRSVKFTEDFVPAFGAVERPPPLPTLKAIKSRLAFSPNAPRWRCADPGLNIEGMCTNRTCVAHSHIVIAPQRWTPFNPTLQSAHCPLCNSPVVPKTCGLYQCKWRFDGVKHDAQVTSSGWQVADGDVYHRFSSDESNLVTWQSLVLVATPLDEPSVYGLCFEGTWGVRGALTRSAGNCQFHALCLTAGGQRPHVQPACPACHARL